MTDYNAEDEMRRHEPKHHSHHPVHEKKTEKPTTDKKSSAPKLLKGLLWVGVAQVILLVVVAFQLSSMSSVLLGPGAGTNTAPTGAAVAAPTPSAPSAPIDMKGLIDDDDVKGDPNAPVTIIEFSDFECPFCARFYSQTLGQIDAKYIQTGKAKLVYRDFPLGFHPQAQKAAEAAECAGEQGKFWEMHDKLFEDGVQGGVTSFKQFAKDIGLTPGEFDSCLDSGEMSAEVQKDFQDGQRVGIRGTPGFVINGELISGAQPFQAFEEVIEAKLAQ